MSFELPEAFVLANQLNTEVKNKVIKSYNVKDYEKHQKDGWFNKDSTFLDKLINNKITSVESVNAIILINFESEHILLIGPEYGGEIRFETINDNKIVKYHLKLLFTDDSTLYIRIKGFGYCVLYEKDDISENYVYKRDSTKIKIIDDEDFTLETFEIELKRKNKPIKSLLIGKEAIVSGIANSLYQEIIYYAKIHPKEKSANLTHEQIRELYSAIKTIIQNRIDQNGKNGIVDIYGNPGGYKPLMDSSYYKKTCITCKTKIDKITVGGGINYFCPRCQKLKI